VIGGDGDQLNLLIEVDLREAFIHDAELMEAMG